MVICLEQSANDLHMVWLMPLPPHRLCFSKIQNGLSFWYWPTQVVLEKTPLNDCVCVCVSRNQTSSLDYQSDMKLIKLSLLLPTAVHSAVSGIKITQGVILRFFALQRRHVAPMGVKFVVEELTIGNVSKFGGGVCSRGSRVMGV